MKLQDIPNGHALILQIEWGTQKIEISSSLMEKGTESIFVSPYIHDGVPLRLSINASSGVKCDLYTTDLDSHERITWKNVSVETISKNDEVFYSISTNAFNRVSSSAERRQSERMLVRRPGKVYDVISDTYTDVMIHDISDSGLSFYAPTSFDCKSSQPIVNFSDIVDDREYVNVVSVSIMRTQKKPGTVLYGCRVVGDTKNYLIYGFMKKLISKSEKDKE